MFELTTQTRLMLDDPAAVVEMVREALSGHMG
jgi:hypothetical protein